MENLKDILGPRGLQKIATALAGAEKKFPKKEFLRELSPKLEQLELKARVKCISDGLLPNLPSNPKQAFPILIKAAQSTEMHPFLVWPFTQFVEDHGLSDPALSLATLKELTKVMSAEFAIRAFLDKHPALTMKTLKKWVRDENVHVRRLVSEGTRPLLPWARRLPAFQKNPSLCLPFLRALRHDPELYVRKSVANHLNDFSKNHPDWLVNELKDWKKIGTKEVDWIIRHALRSLLKNGHQGALALLDLNPPKITKSRLSLSKNKIKLGQDLEISFSAQASKSAKWMVDYAIHHKKANGRSKPKVFKWRSFLVQRGQLVQLTKKHKFKPISTRRYYSGEHEVEVFLNGKSQGKKGFYLHL